MEGGSSPLMERGSSPFMGRWREAPEGQRRRGSAGGAAPEGQRRRGSAGGAAPEGQRRRGSAGGAAPRGLQRWSLDGDPLERLRVLVAALLAHIAMPLAHELLEVPLAARLGD